jgi:hypothetical protein
MHGASIVSSAGRACTRRAVMAILGLMSLGIPIPG